MSTNCTNVTMNCSHGFLFLRFPIVSRTQRADNERMSPQNKKDYC